MYRLATGSKKRMLQLLFGIWCLTAMVVTAGVAPALAGDPTFTYGGTIPWFSQNLITHDGIDAQQSGAISHNQFSWQETSVTGPGAVRFWWKVSSESCCDQLQFSIDGIAQNDIRGEIDWQARAYSIPAGIHTLRWSYSTDSSLLGGSNAGWVDQVTFQAGSDIDVTPPVTSASPAGGTIATTQSVMLSANEPSTIYYTTDGSEPTTSSSQYTAPITISSSTTLKFFAVDTAGNYELTKSAAYTFDTSPPSTHPSISAGSYSGVRDVSLHCSDSGMGCAATYYCLGSSCTPATPYSSAIAITSTSVLRFYSTDRAGNSEAIITSAYTITPDSTPPVTTPSTPGGTYGQFYVFLTCSDGNGSGCANTYYCLGTGCTPGTAISSGIQITASTDLRFYSLDRSGNSEGVQTATYTIDKTPPVTTANPPGGSYESAPLVTLTCSDSTGTGCSRIYYCTGENCSPSNLYAGPVPIHDTTVLRFYSTDIASNDEAIVTQSYVNPGQPKTITVPGMRSTIQSAIDAAYNGDTVLVSPGTYVENIDFKGKGIAVKSSDGPESTIIDGNQAGSVVTFSSGENLSAELNGFTIRNGANSWQGGGIYIDHASPTILNNRITGNSASWGAGIDVNFASPSIRNNIITSNTGGSYGGGICIGGAASAQIIDNTISDNKSADGGGIGMWAAGTPLIQGNRIMNNSANYSGGGIYIVNSSNSMIIQNLIAINKAATGGAVYGGSNDDSFVNNTLVNNTSAQGASVYVPNAPFVNNIVVSVSGQTAMDRSSSYLLNFSHNLVYSPSGIAYADPCPDQNGINGNITADPLLSGEAFGYYGLRPGSPAIDAGDNSAPSLPATDFGGMPRVTDGNAGGTATVDIGAYEFDPTYPVAKLQGIPTGFLASNSLTITVVGTDVVSYRYALDGGAFTNADCVVTTPINLTNLANGQHTIVVLGKNALGREQLLSSATAASWVVNMETTNLTFTNGGTAPWFVQPSVSRDGIAYQSGAISNNQASWMETTVTGPGAIRFWWKVSSAYYSDYLSFAIDGTNQTTITGEVDWQYQAFSIPSGNHTIRWNYATDGNWLSNTNAGWVDQIVFEQGSNIDITPPVTLASPAGTTVSSPQAVTLSASEPATIYFTTNGSEPTVSSTRYTTPITIGSSTTLKFFAVDTAGNYEQPKSVTYTFDTSPPSTHANLDAGTYSGGRDVSLYCSDSGGMGCATTYFCLGSGCIPATPYSSAIAISASTDLRYYSVDNGGNREAVNTLAFTITPDVIAPTTTSSYAAGTYHPISISLFCSDGAGSGCATTYYCLGAGCTPATPYSSYVYLSASTDLRFYSVDRSGNSATVSTASYTIDATPPMTTPSVGGGIYSTPQSVALSCSDGTGSGCTSTSYCLGKGCSPSTQYSGPIGITSSTYLSYFSRDTVYNQETIKTERYTILTAPATTINVPADRTTIQAAIDAANDGDTVLVAPGTYVENIDIKGKAITVESSGGSDLTTIDGNKRGSVVVFTSAEWNTTILRGFTVRNGGLVTGYSDSLKGGGVYISSASPTISNNKIIQNLGCYGAGIYASGSPIIRNNLISNNYQSACGGNSSGGGIYLEGYSAQVIDNTISYNAMQYGSGGGILIYGSGRNLIRGNIITHNGGLDINGGGIYAANLTGAQIVQNLIAGNSARYGGGVYLAHDTLLANNTVSDNDAANGSGVYIDGYTWGNGSNGLIVNNVIIGKSGQTAIHSESSSDSNPLLKNNVFFSPENNVYGGTYSDQNGINGNITADPLLAGPEFGYYGLRSGSPAIDSGDGSAPLLTAIDLNGAPRLIDGSGQGLARIDIGAYEYDPFEQRAIMTNAPVGATRETSASIDVSGPGIITYRYALDGGSFTTADTPITTPIVLTGLAGGNHAVAVIGKTSAREQQVSSATVAGWTIDTIPPVTTATPAGGNFSAPQAVTLTCSDSSGSGCAGTFYCLGGDCTPATPYSGPVTVSATAGLRYFSRDAFGYQEAIRTASFTFVGTISGQITDSGSGAAIQGINISAYSAATGSMLGYGYTDSSGSYQITGLASGSYKLRFYAEGYVEQWYSGKSDRAAADAVSVSAPGATTGINAIMVKSGSISGFVSGSDSGLGVQSVSVSAYNVNTGSWGGYGYTDSSGAYTISGLPAGDYKLSFDSQNNSGYLSQWYSNKADLATATTVRVANAANTSGINVVLLKGGSITGTVTDSVSGAVIPNIYVTAVNAVTGAWINSGCTDSSGAYSISRLAAGSYKLRFSGAGYVEQWYSGKASQTSAAIVTVTAPNTTSGINLAMVKGAGITGTVTDSATGSGIPGAYVIAYNAVSGTWAGTGYADDTGAYSVSGLTTGSYKLRFSAYGFEDRWSGGKADQVAAAVVSVTAPISTAGINMGLVKGAVISGTVIDRDTGAGIQGVYVVAYNAASGSWAGSANTDSSGNYTITGLVSGNYKLQFSGSSSDGYLVQWFNNKEWSSSANIVSVAAPNITTNIDVSMAKGAAITGTVTDRDTGSAIQGVYVTAFNAASGHSAGSGYTDYSGSYSVSGLSTGNYKLVFDRSGYARQWFDGKADQTTATIVSVAAPNASAGINVVLGKAASISGTIADRITGAGIAGVSLYVIDRSSGDWAGNAQTDGNGAYTIIGLVSGSYRLRIDPPYGSGYLGGWYGGQDAYLCAGTVSVSAPNDTNGIDAWLDMGGSISGRVTDVTTGSGISGVNILLTNTTTQIVTSISNTTVDPTGAYTIGGLANGVYSLSFSAPGYVRATSPAVVRVSAPDAISGVDGSLVRGGGISGRITDSATGIGVYGIVVYAVDSQTHSWAGSSASDPNGDYVITPLPSGSYTLYYDGSNAGGGSGSGWISSGSGVSMTTTSVTNPIVVAVSGKSVASSVSSTPLSSSLSTNYTAAPLSQPVVVEAPAVTGGIDFSVDRMGSIAGLVTDSSAGEPLDWISVSAIDSVSGASVASTISNRDGSYRINGVPSGRYRVRFTSMRSANGGYLSAWYGNGATSDVITVLTPEITTGIDARLSRGGGISGSISVTSCPGPREVNIIAYDAASGSQAGQTWVDTSNADRFTIGALPAGSYKLAINPGEAGFIRQWYPNKTEIAGAEPVGVTAGSITGGIDVALAAGGGSISGEVSGNGGCSFIPASVKLYDWYSGGFVADASVSPAGTYQLTGLPDAVYKLVFTLNQLPRWYRTAEETARNSSVVVSGAVAVTGVDLADACLHNGDLDGSGGSPSLGDALKALRISVGLDSATPEILARGDLAPIINGVSEPDDMINIADALLILRRVVGLPFVNVAN